jgi:hypothetical protein
MPRWVRWQFGLPHMRQATPQSTRRPEISELRQQAEQRAAAALQPGEATDRAAMGTVPKSE